ncbi:protein amalgam-like [Nilaparvata lugens]|uniref:protein amalgam-like n=1 Tax=Nilaparvata lugens TaxID=108931 RepID=UPI00193EA862|nr:protein amalgam-like [Nilaparvata lugens]
MFQLSAGLLVMALFVNSALATETSDEDSTPKFMRPIGNVSVPLGHEAILVCAVSGLGDYMLGWVRLLDQTVLSLHTQVMTPSSRFLTTHDNQNQWKLHIKGVTAKDIGCYMCQINTKVMKNQIGCLDVLIPPDIKDEGTSYEVIVQEGGDADLTCNAVGVPMPKVTWKREDNQNVVLNGSHLVASPGDDDTRKQSSSHSVASPGGGDSRKLSGIHLLAAMRKQSKRRKQSGSHLVASPKDGDTRNESDSHLVASLGDTRKPSSSQLVASSGDSHVVGPIIHFTNVNRMQSGKYVCIATNEVPPAVSKLISLHVQFEPKLTVDNIVVGAVLGGVASMSCTAEMSPVTPVTWSMSDTKCGDRCRIEETKNAYMLQTKLIITDVSSQDFGDYHCTAETNGTRLTKMVRLHDMTPTTTKPPPTTSTTTETTTATVKVTTAKAKRPRVTTSTSTEIAPQNYQVPVVIENGVRIEGDVIAGNPSSGSRRSDGVIKSRASSIHKSVAQLFLLGFFWLMDQALKQ